MLSIFKLGTLNLVAHTTIKDDRIQVTLSVFKNFMK